MRSGWWKRVEIAGGLAVAAILAAVVGWTLVLSWRPSDRYRFQGVDMSEANGPVDWWTVRKGGADFAYLRATSGTGPRDARFEGNWAGVAETGMRRGAMHLYSLCRLAADQANAFITTVPRAPDALPAAVELDFTGDCAARPDRAIVLDELRRYLTMVEAHTGKPVLLKLSKAFDARYAVSTAIPRSIWAVQDFLPPDYAAKPWRMWQASDMRRIDGVEGAVHWDVVAP